MIKKIKSFFHSLFSDDNSINEKAVVGFSAFMLLAFVLVIDVITGILGHELPIHEFVFDGFLVITLGSLGIASFDKIFANKDKSDKSDK